MKQKRVAILFRHTPHGGASGREALDAALACSALIDNIGIFFIGDGVFHLLPQQEPALILARDYIATLGVLSIYDIDDRYVCHHSLQQRGLALGQLTSAVEVTSLRPESLRTKLREYDVMLSF